MKKGGESNATRLSRTHYGQEKYCACRRHRGHNFLESFRTIHESLRVTILCGYGTTLSQLMSILAMQTGIVRKTRGTKTGRNAHDQGTSFAQRTPRVGPQ